MNFLFATVLVLLLVSPGLAFFRAYYSDVFSIRYSRLTVTDQLFRSVVPGLTVQLIAFWCIGQFTPYYVRLDLIGFLLLGAKEDNTLRTSFDNLAVHLAPIIAYHVGLLMLGALLGWGFRRLVRRTKADRRFRALRFDNAWHYLLTGEILEMSDQKSHSTIQLKEASHISYVLLDILIKLEQGNTLYSGILERYELGEAGNLDALYLTGAHRKQLLTGTGDEPTEVRYYPVDGDLLVIPYAQVLNMNITYFIDEKTAREEGDTEPEGEPTIQIEEN
ncbi:MAG: hypothetical protein EAZ91_17060 [Cytophagales bacterium]|nr:MAG: hypothetical protein EAZ91_17060 [Cytophagales bacterium]